MEFKHKSVLLDEVIDNLNIKEDGIYVDGTLGGAGHSTEILKRLSNGTLIGIDRDMDAIRESAKKLEQYEKNNKVILIHGNHENIPSILDSLEIKKVDGVLLDLGMSSYQIDNGKRGFSYINDGPLDMRMDESQELTAKKIVNEYSKEELVEIFKKYGEERFAEKIANAIIKKREEKEISTTQELVDIIDGAKPFSKKGHKAKQVFQALRIEVNSEIKNLTDSIIEIIKRINKGGRLTIITFHSLEDKAVKEAYKKAEGECICPPNFPICVCNPIKLGKIVNKKAILPSKEEQEENSRSKSAKLRVFEID